jgi:hypothetical protein
MALLLSFTLLLPLYKLKNRAPVIMTELATVARKVKQISAVLTELVTAASKAEQGSCNHG